MASPFPPNLFLYTQQPRKSEFVRDEFNNLVPACPPKEKPIEVYALRDGKEPDFLQEKGRDETLMAFSCRSVKPKYIPGWLQPGSEVECVYKEPASKIRQEGVFVITEISNSPWKSVQKALGTSFKGYFKQGLRGDGKSDLEPAKNYKERLPL